MAASSTAAIPEVVASTEVSSTIALATPEAKRQRADRSISPMAIDHATHVPATPLVDADGRSYAAPATPDASGLAPLCRSDLAEMFERFANLIKPLQDSIQGTVETANQPIQQDVLALTRRIDAIEEHCASANAEGDQPRGWNAWQDYDNKDYDNQHPAPAAEPSWAERAAHVGKGSGKSSAAAARPPRGAAGAASAKSSAASRPAAVNPGKLRISTLGGARVKHDDIKIAVCSFINEGNQPVD